MNHDHDDRQPNGRWSAASKYVFIGFALIAGYFLLTEHRAHVVQYLPFLLLLACPLMHLFHGHGGHGGHGGDTRSGNRPEKPSANQGSDPEQHHHH